MASDVSINDFSSESDVPLPMGDPAPEIQPEPDPPDEAPAPETPEEPVAEPTAEPQAAKGDRNADGTFKPKGKQTVQQRIDHATWEREEARREAAAERGRREELERRLAALEAPQRQPAPPQARQAPTADPSDPEPDPNNTEKYAEGQYDRQFLKDQARWEARQEFQQQQRVQMQRQFLAQQQHQQHQRVSGYQERMQAVLATDPEFVSRLSPEVINLRPTSQLERGQPPTPLTDLADEVMDSPHTAALLQHFSEHPDDLRRFAGLPTKRSLLVEFAKLETRFETAPTGSVSKAPVLSQAKPPIRPVGSAPAVTDEPPDDSASFDDHVRYHNAKEKRLMPRRSR